MDSGFHSGATPLVFIRPVGFTAADSLRLMQAAQRLNEHVRWRLAPAGVQADVYLAHRANAVYANARTAGRRSKSSNSNHSSQGHDSSTDSSTNAYINTQIRLNSKGLYRGHPVCLLGRAGDVRRYDQSFPTLQFPAALEDLRHGLKHIEENLFGLRSMYAMGRRAWEERTRWKTHRLQVFEGTRLIGAIEPGLWRVHILSDAPLELIEQGHTMLVPQSSAFGAPGFQSLPLERALWEFAKRCPEAMLDRILPHAYLTERLTHRRHSDLSERELGDHCVAILSALDTSSRSAADLQKGLRMSRPALLRALACLALTRSIRPEQRSKGLRLWLKWLPQSLRTKVFGPSALI